MNQNPCRQINYYELLNYIFKKTQSKLELIIYYSTLIIYL